MVTATVDEERILGKINAILPSPDLETKKVDVTVPITNTGEVGHEFKVKITISRGLWWGMVYVVRQYLEVGESASPSIQSDILTFDVGDKLDIEACLLTSTRDLVDSMTVSVNVT
jgi:hypothetical protein